MSIRIVQFGATAAFATLCVATLSYGQETLTVKVSDALSQSAAGATIPMTSYTVQGPDGKTYSGVLAGGNPTASAGSKPVTIEAVLIPLVIGIGQPDGTIVTFDPTEPDTNCDGGVSAETRFKQSPLVVDSTLAFNGVSVGKAQYIEGFMRAEFWNIPNFNRSSYFNHLNWSFAPAYPFAYVSPENGVVNGTGCDQTGVVSKAFFNTMLTDFLVPTLQASGEISPTNFALFLTKNVSTAEHLTYGFVLAGEHFATGSPIQTWAWARYAHTTSTTQPTDVHSASHEIGEWMNDPLITNSTPAWGHTGEVANCSTKLEVGDPLNKHIMPVMTLSGYGYHVQELAFIGWFFGFSTGTGGEYSGNGTFEGPATLCSP